MNTKSPYDQRMRNPATDKIMLEKVRFALLSPCNLRCTYCRPGGEGGVGSSKALSVDRALFLSSVFQKLRCAKVNLTGGEPFLHRKLGEICSRLLSETDFNVTLNTNGTIPLSRHPKLKPSNRLNMVVSLDATSTEKLVQTGRVTRFEVIDRFVKNASDVGFKVRINAVIVKGVNDNIENIVDLIEYCLRLKVDLKLQSVFNISNDMFKPAASQYIPLEVCHDVCKGLGFEPGEKLNRKNGVAENVYITANATKIRVLDRDPSSTRYGGPCQKCANFPCDTGLYAYYVTENEKLILCRHRRETIFSFKNRFDADTAAIELLDKLALIEYSKVLPEASIKALHANDGCYSESHENCTNECL